MNRSTCRWVRAPKGTYRGRWPQNATGPLLEHQLAAELAHQVCGAIEVVLFCGRADVATDTDIFEVEPVDNWRHGLRQVLAYAAETGLAPRLALFGARENVEDIYLKLRDRAQLTNALWVHDGWSWKHITNRAAAKRRLRAQVRKASA